MHLAVPVRDRADAAKRSVEQSLLGPLTPTRQEALFLALFVVVLLVQLFLPGFIGTANNGDFPKITGRFCVAGTDHWADNFLFFQTDYVRDPKNCWNPGIPSSELPMAWLAFTAAGIFQRNGHIDIRWNAAVHCIVFVAFFYALLLLLRPLKTPARVLLSMIAVWIFTDVSIVSYFNSFWMDAAGIAFGLLAAVLANHLLASDRMRPLLLALFGFSTVMFATAKGPNAAVAVVPFVFLVVVTLRARTLSTRVTGATVCAAMLAGAIAFVMEPPSWYGGQPRFSLIFYKITPQSKTPAKDLQQLGLDKSYLRYVGMHSYMPGSPMEDGHSSDVFCRRSSYGKVLRFYMQHPGVALKFLWGDVTVSAQERRQSNLSNFQRKDGHPAGARTNRFASWSNLRSSMFAHWPGHILIWYGFVLLALPFVIARDGSQYRRAVGWTIVAISLMAAGEFGIASLSDACETGRHLIMFHVLTDMAIFLGLVLAAASLQMTVPAGVRNGRA